MSNKAVYMDMDIQGVPKKRPMKKYNITHNFLFQMYIRNGYSPIGPLSNALYPIKFGRLIPKILPICWQQCKLPSGHFLACMGYFVEKELVCKFRCHWFDKISEPSKMVTLYFLLVF